MVVGQLITREPQIDQDAIDLCEFELGKHFRQVGIVGVGHGHRQPLQLLLGSGNDCRITIEPDHQTVFTDFLCQQAGVPAPTERAIDKCAARLRREPLDHFLGEDRLVDARCHGCASGLKLRRASTYRKTANLGSGKIVIRLADCPLRKKSPTRGHFRVPKCGWVPAAGLQDKPATYVRSRGTSVTFFYGSRESMLRIDDPQVSIGGR